MCMGEFIKRLYDFMDIYKKIWSQNSDYRYLPIFYRYLPIFTDILPIFTDILLIFFQKFLHKRACSTVAIFRWKNRFFPIFRRKIGDFTDFSSDFSSRCRPKTDFSAKYRSKKPIFCSMVPNSTHIHITYTEYQYECHMPNPMPRVLTDSLTNAICHV